MNYVQEVMDKLAEEMPDCPVTLVRLYTLLALVKGREITLQDVHDAWAIWRQGTSPDHKYLIPFDQLPAEIQELDREYMEAIHRCSPPAVTS